MSASPPKWLVLQRKIFSRWVNQKLYLSRNIKVDDIVTAFKDGKVLLALLEVLSEEKYTGKFNNNAKMKVHHLDNLSNVLKFCWSLGVNLDNKPSNEQIYEGDERVILSLVWAIMLKFMRVGDEDDQALGPKEALLLWAQNKTAGYKGVDLKDFGKCWHNGLALCAIIHRHRPKLIDYDSLSKSNGVENLRIAMDAANKYFGLEKYIEPEDIPILDSNTMVVYVSEYFYGIQEQRKKDLAARRIGKVIKLTEENDAMRASYKENADSIVGLMKKAEELMAERTIDNTMAGAKKRLDQFYEYKAGDKTEILSKQLELEALFNNLVMRLSHHKRPDFKPDLSLKDVSSKVDELEKCEQERKAALHAELNRQIKLQKLDAQHTSRSNKLSAWVEEKTKYLKDREDITSISEAQLHLKKLDAHKDEKAGDAKERLDKIKELGKELEKELYEKTESVKERESKLDEGFLELDTLAGEKKGYLDQCLEREKEKERLRLEFAHLAASFVSWTREASENLEHGHFGFTLEEVEAYQSKLDKLEEDIEATAQEKKTAYQAVDEALKSYNVTDNPFTKLTVDSLEESLNKLKSALDAYKKEYEKELEKQRADDALCKEFAQVCDTFYKKIAEKKDGVTASKESLDDQLKSVKDLQSSKDTDGSDLGKIKELSEKMSSRGIQHNRHTILTLKDAQVQFEQYQSFLNKKQKMLEEAIEHEKMKGLTPDEVKEIEENFKLFDKNSTGSLERRELKNCLYSLGEEKSNKEVAQILKDHGNGEKIEYAGFKEFMTNLLGDSDTKEEILDGFKLINQGDPPTDPEKLDMVMAEHDMEYFKNTAPKSGEGYDHVAWTDDVFSR